MTFYNCSCCIQCLDGRFYISLSLCVPCLVPERLVGRDGRPALLEELQHARLAQERHHAVVVRQRRVQAGTGAGAVVAWEGKEGERQEKVLCFAPIRSRVLIC